MLDLEECVKKPPWCSGNVTRLGRRFDPGLLQSVGWDYKPRSCLHMTLAVGGMLNPNQSINQSINQSRSVLKTGAARDFQHSSRDQAHVNE